MAVNVHFCKCPLLGLDTPHPQECANVCVRFLSSPWLPITKRTTKTNDAAVRPIVFWLQPFWLPSRADKQQLDWTGWRQARERVYQRAHARGDTQLRSSTNTLLSSSARWNRSSGGLQERCNAHITHLTAKVNYDPPPYSVTWPERSRWVA